MRQKPLLLWFYMGKQKLEDQKCKQRIYSGSSELGEQREGACASFTHTASSPSAITSSQVNVLFFLFDKSWCLIFLLVILPILSHLGCCNNLKPQSTFTPYPTWWIYSAPWGPTLFHTISLLYIYIYIYIYNSWIFRCNITFEWWYIPPFS